MINVRQYWGRYGKPEVLIYQMARQELARWGKKLLPNHRVPQRVAAAVGSDGDVQDSCVMFGEALEDRFI